MPFDGLPEQRVRLHAFAGILRNPRLWPVGFKWNYQHCESCAIGLMRELWGEQAYWNVSAEMRIQIFTGLSRRLDIYMHKVKPEYVAHAIDSYLQTGRIDIDGIRKMMPWRDRWFSWF